MYHRLVVARYFGCVDLKNIEAVAVHEYSFLSCISLPDCDEARKEGYVFSAYLVCHMPLLCSLVNVKLVKILINKAYAVGFLLFFL